MRSYRLHKIFLAMTLLVDGTVIAGAFLLAWWIRFSSGWIAFEPPGPPFGAYLIALPITLAAYLLFFNYAGLYQRRLSVIGTGDLGSIVRAVALVTLLLFALGFLYRGYSYSRLVTVLMGAMNIVLLRAGRGAIRRVQVALRRRGIGVVRVAILGDGPEARALATTLKRHPGYGYRLAGYFGTARASGDLAPRLGPAVKLRALLPRVRPDEVLLAPPQGFARDAVADAALACRQAGVEVRMLADVYGLVTSRLVLEDLFGLPVLSLTPHPLARWPNRALKRTVDLVLSGFGVLVLAPVLLAVAAVVKLDSPGPVFYGQERVGRDGRTFRMLKFRSMRADAERKTGPVWAHKNDPRRTRSGGFLRRTSLDELPQLLNILRGEMSIVGPRPERPHFVEAFSREVPRYMERHAVPPGLTGWAQINGLRGNTPVDERTLYDLFYIEHWSAWLDMKIVFRTAMEVFHHQEAY